MEILEFLLQILTSLFSIIALGINSFLLYYIFKKGKKIDERLLLFFEKNKFKLAALDKRLQVFPLYH
jgi:hypothetical protein